jgi:hypothetical protein
MPLSGASRTKAMRLEEGVGTSARDGYRAPRLAVNNEAARITAVRAPLLGLLLMVAAPLTLNVATLTTSATGVRFHPRS